MDQSYFQDVIAMDKTNVQKEKKSRNRVQLDYETSKKNAMGYPTRIYNSWINWSIIDDYWSY